MTTSAYPFYAYWNGEQVSDLWTTIAALTSTQDYRTLLICVAVFGFLSVMIGAAVRYRGQDAITWFAATIVVFSVAFVPRVNINVLDVRGGYTQVINDVPIGIGWPASTISRVSYWLTQTFETAFNDVDATSYTRFGMAFPQRVVTSVLSVKPITEYGRVSLVNFSERCVVPEILDNPTKRQALMTAPDIYALISSDGWVNPARRVMIADKVLSCPEALKTLYDALHNHELPALESMLVNQLSLNADDVVSGSVRAAIPNAESVMLGVSRSLTESLRQSVMMAAIPQATMNTAAKAGQAPLSAAVAMARAQGNLASEINYRTLSEMAKSALPKLRNLLEFIVIGLFPITFLLAIGLGTSGIVVIRAYFTLLISVSLWAPITSIMNYLMIHVDAEPLNRLVDAAGGVTLAAATMIRDGGATSQAMAGSLMWLVPVLAYAVAKGSDMALTSMASSVLSPASSAAQAQGSALAAGNVSAGNASLSNVSTNNVNANKTDLGSSYTSPNQHTTHTPYGDWSADRSTGNVTAMRVASTDMGIQSMGQFSKQSTSGTIASEDSHANKGNMSSRGEGTSLVNNHTTNSATTEKEGWNETKGDGITELTSNSDQYQTANAIGNTSQFGITGNVSETFGNSTGLQGSTRSLTNSNTSPEGDKNPTASNLNTLFDPNLTEPAVVNTPDGFKLAMPDKSNNKSRLPSNLFNQTHGLNIDIKGTTQGFKSQIAGNGSNSSNTEGFITNKTENTSNTVTNSNAYQTGKDANYSDVDNSTIADTTNVQNQEQVSTGINNQHGVVFNKQKQGNIGTTVNLGNTIRDHALTKFGDPNNALEQLNNSFKRISFGNEIRQLTESKDVFSTSVRNNVPERGFNHIDTNKHRDELRDKHRQENQKIRDIYDFSAKERGEEKEIQSLSGKTVIPISKKEKDDLYLKQGIAKAASNEFIKDNTGVVSTLLLSYLGGLGHNSPEKIANNLLQESSKNPKLKESLIELGRSRN